ncbi:tsukushi-like [Anopheles nili]|uniref:tsukushi-like n=1 Tax=Anopheles nili TaxID=185578 RepID=UPI00237B4CDB|nr:tsukushi-like [Anopheles nili]
MFDFRTWAWTELDFFQNANKSCGAYIELIFNGFNTPIINLLQGHNCVTSLNLDENQISSLKHKAFNQLPYMKKLSLRYNKISAIDNDFFSPLLRIEYLDLSSNNIMDISGFNKLTRHMLNHLNLSHNHIVKVSSYLFNLSSLEVLDLSNNSIKSSEPIMLPTNLRHLKLDNNEIVTWPLDFIPARLTDLSLKFNQLNYTKPISSVKRLDLSNNRLNNFCSDHFSSLEELDLSGNYFDSIPSFRSNKTLPLRKLAFNYMPNLLSIRQESFEGAANLTEISISVCPRLSLIESETFTGLNWLEKLDLSYNNLEKLPKDMARWLRIKDGVNLQGNPIKCDCSMQWFVDYVLSPMHSRPEMHILFLELKCAGPEIFKDLQMVRFTIHENLLCLPMQDVLQLPGMQWLEKIVNNLNPSNQAQSNNITLNVQK